MRTAIITGASSGLGKEFVRAVCAYPEYESIWVIARRRERLDELAAEYGDRIRPVVLDLTDETSLEQLECELKENDPDVRLLINNAGAGVIGDFRDGDSKAQGAMVTLNDRAVTEMTCAVLRYMKKGAAIINTCSIASFAPNPGMTVYSATKAYIMSFSRGLRYELKKDGINVLAVCPGPMDTEFLPIAGIEKGTSKTFDTLPRTDPAVIADKAVRKAFRGKAVYTPRFFFKFYRFVAKILPHGIVMHMSKT